MTAVRSFMPRISGNSELINKTALACQLAQQAHFGLSATSAAPLVGDQQFWIAGYHLANNTFWLPPPAGYPLLMLLARICRAVIDSRAWPLGGRINEYQAAQARRQVTTMFSRSVFPGTAHRACGLPGCRPCPAPWHHSGA
jgi:hypothetical protein